MIINDNLCIMYNVESRGGITESIPFISEQSLINFKEVKL